MLRGIGSFIIAIIALISLLVIGLAAVFFSLPDVRKLGHCMTTELYHVHLCESDSHFAPFTEISPNIIGAVIMSEDASFYSHQGVDLYEMKQSMKKDVSEMRFARGASTITQQLAKNAFLSKSKNVVRKLEEIYLALQIEKYFNKAKILTYYLNVVEFGKDMYGVKDACRFYFKKSPSEVNPEEGAFLAFLLPNPKKYSQSFTHHRLTAFAEKTIKTILHKMMLGHKITEDEYASAIARVPEFPWNGSTPVAAPPDDETVTDESTMPEDNSENAETQVKQPDAPQDESNQDDDEFKFDFAPEDSK
jgi:monofunctional biosynthetic peptidoglycan transglycosylase